MSIKVKLIFCLLLSTLAVSFASAQDDESAKVRGRVTNYFGNPIVDEEVKFFLLEGKVGGGYVSAEGRFIKSASTDKGGNYSISGLPAGNYRVEAGTAEVWEFYLWMKAERVLDLGELFGITHGFPQLEVVGKVKHFDKTSAKDATVTLINAFDETAIWRTRTDKSGDYKIEFIQPGQYILYVSKPGYAVSVTSFLINALKGIEVPETGKRKKMDVVLSPLR